MSDDARPSPESAPASAGADAPVGGSRRFLGVALRWLLLLAVLAGFAFALNGKWRAVGHELASLDPGVIALAGLLCLVGTTATAQSWRAILRDLGSAVPLIPGARIFFVGQLGKYLPGSVWPLLVQMRLGQRLGVPRTRMAVAFIVTLGLSVALGLLVGLAALPSLLTGEHRGYAWLLAILPFGLAFLHPRLLNAVLGRALRITRRPALEHPLTVRGVIESSVGILAFWLVGGLHVWLLSVDLGADPLPALPVALGGFALGFCVGPLLVVLPAGAGVREAVMGVVLVGILPAEQALAVVLVSRFLLAASDGLLAGAAVLLDARSSRSTPTPSTTTR